MKNFYLSIVAILIAFALFSCSDSDLTSNYDSDNAAITNPKGGNITSIANPVIAYISSVQSGSGKNKAVYQTIGVMDTTGLNQTNVYTASTTSELDRYPTWSPDGISLSWIKRINGYSGPSEIVAADISVNSNGVPVAGNYRTIAKVPYESPNYFWISNQAWCSLASTGKVAFVVTYGTGTSGWTYLYTVSTSGGAWDMLSSIYDPIGTGGEYYMNLCWSPDDSKIAILLHSSSRGNKILIYDNQTRTFTDSIPTPPGILGFGPLDWSRNGMNSLAFTANSSGGSYIYYVTPPTNGTIPTTNGVSGSFPSWSPNNSSLLFKAFPSSGGIKGGLKKMIPFTTNVTTISSSFTGFSLNWKK